MKEIHSIWAIALIITLIFAVIIFLKGYFLKKDYTQKNYKLGLITMILLHTQFIIGLVAYFVGNWHSLFGNMKNKDIRLITLEHPLIMIISIVLITIGWSKHKKKRTSENKFKTLAIFYSIALVLCLSRIPWKNLMNSWF